MAVEGVLAVLPLELPGDELGVLLGELLVLCVVCAHVVWLLELAFALCVVRTHLVRLLELPGGGAS